MAINNTLADGELQGMVALYGYGSDKMQERQHLYDTAIDSTCGNGNSGSQNRYEEIVI